MALITCPECHKEVSSFAENCPNCAYPLKNMGIDGKTTIRIKIPYIMKNGQDVHIINDDTGTEICTTKFGSVATFTITEDTYISFKWGIGKAKGRSLVTRDWTTYEIRYTNTLFAGIQINLNKIDVIETEG